MTSTPKAKQATAEAERDEKLVPAAWPTGMARYGAVVTDCKACPEAEACDRWIAQSPEKPVAPPPFCPNLPDVAKENVTKRD